VATRLMTKNPPVRRKPSNVCVFIGYVSLGPITVTAYPPLVRCPKIPEGFGGRQSK